MLELLIRALLSGLTLGCTYGLIALGLSIIFGIMDIINMAHGPFVILAGYLAYWLFVLNSMDPITSLPIIALCMAIMGSGVYTLLLRPSLRGGHFMTLLFTYGLGIFLTELMLLMWTADYRCIMIEWLERPIGIGVAVATLGEWICLGVSTTSMILVHLFLRRTRLGKAIRAVAQDREATALMGINISRIELLGFCLGLSLGGIAGALFAMLYYIFPQLGDTLTATGFVVTVLAGMENIPGILAGGILLGTAEALTSAFVSAEVQRLTGLAIFIVVLLAKRNGALGSVGQFAETDRYQLGDGRIWASLCLALLLILPIASGNNPFLLRTMTIALLLAGISVAWAILGGLCGQVSLGHVAFFGTGAYVSALLALHGCSPAISVWIGAILGGLLLGAIAVPLLKLRGPYFALAMLALGDIMKYVVIYLKNWTGGASGLYGVPSLPSFSFMGITVNFHHDVVPNYYVFLAFMLAATLISYGLRNSKYGLAFKAIRSDEIAASTRGINPLKYKAVALLVSAFLTALAGALYVHYVHYIYPDEAYSHAWSILPIVASLLGGMWHVAGPCVGGVLLYLMNALVFRRLLPRGHQMFTGLMLMALVMLMPSGILGASGEKSGGGRKT